MLPTYIPPQYISSGRGDRTILATALRQVQLRFSRKVLRALRRIRPFVILGLVLGLIASLYYIALALSLRGSEKNIR